MIKMMGLYMGLAVGALRRNRMRTLLTCLGIAVGVACIVVVLSLTGSVRKNLQGQTEVMGEGLVVVRMKREEMGTEIINKTWRGRREEAGIELKEVGKMKEIAGVKAVVPVAGMYEKVVGEKIENALVVGTKEELEDLQGLKMKAGVFFGGGSEKNQAVLGRELCLKLFGTTQAVGKTLEMFGRQVLVVGVLEEVNNPVNIDNLDFNDVAMVNLDFLVEAGQKIQVRQVNVRVEGEKIGAVMQELAERAKSWRGEYEVVTGGEIVKTVNPTFKVMGEMLWVVAVVALVIGGVGVMNIMLVAANERTREIGIRKAVGATGGNIMGQFLLEAVMLALLGGVLGVILGHGVAAGVALSLHIEPFASVETVGVTLLVALVVGVIFGVYPAGVAARKSPIGALKYYR